MMSIPREFLESSGMLSMLDKVAGTPGMTERELLMDDGGLNGAMIRHERLRTLVSLGLVEQEVAHNGWDGIRLYPTEEGRAFISKYLQ